MKKIKLSAKTKEFAQCRLRYWQNQYKGHVIKWMMHLPKNHNFRMAVVESLPWPSGSIVRMYDAKTTAQLRETARLQKEREAHAKTPLGIAEKALENARTTAANATTRVNELTRERDNLLKSNTEQASKLAQTNKDLAAARASLHQAGYLIETLSSAGIKAGELVRVASQHMNR